MSTGRDDDALSWDGDDDPTLDTGAASAPDDEPSQDAPTVALPDGFMPVGRGSETLARSTSAASDRASNETTAVDVDAAVGERAPMGSAQLVTLGVLGGVYALFAIGWLVGGLRLQGWRPFLVTDAMYQGSLWLAVLTPLLWFATVFLLTRSARTWVRLVWLAAGVVLLVPWPFVLIGAVGQ